MRQEKAKDALVKEEEIAGSERVFSSFKFSVATTQKIKMFV